MGQMITLENDGPFDAYVASPPGTPKGGLIVIEEIWGLADHIKDVADRFAAEGYLVVSPDILGRVGITAHLGAELQELLHHPDEKVRTEGQPKLREAMGPARSPEFAAWAVPALVSAVDYLAAQPGIGDNLAVTGFCFGGTYSFALAAVDPRIRAAVPFYGQPPATTDLDGIACPILAFYGENDANLINTLPEVTEAMKDAEVDFESKVYEGTGHAFFNDTNVLAYNRAAATDSWKRTLAFLEGNLDQA
jgi:carboxymethylenebutenolidase